MDTHTPDASPQDINPTKPEITEEVLAADYIPDPPRPDTGGDSRVSPTLELEEWMRGMLALLLGRAIPGCAKAYVVDAGKPALLVMTEQGTFAIKISKVSDAVMDKLH